MEAHGAFTNDSATEITIGSLIEGSGCVDIFAHVGILFCGWNASSNLTR